MSDVLTTAVTLTEAGAAVLASLGIDVTTAPSAKRTACRACMDWSERRHHLAGAVGARVLERCLERGWARRVEDSRAIVVDARGERALSAPFRHGASC